MKYLYMRYSTLSQVIHAVAALLYPFTWQHTFISIVPEVLIDVVMAPTPYLLGVTRNMLDLVEDHSDVSSLLNGCYIVTHCQRQSLHDFHDSPVQMTSQGTYFQGSVLCVESRVLFSVKSLQLVVLPLKFVYVLFNVESPWRLRKH